MVALMGAISSCLPGCSGNGGDNENQLGGGSPTAPEALPEVSDDGYVWCGDDDCYVAANSSSYYVFSLPEAVYPLSVRVITPKSSDKPFLSGTLLYDQGDLDRACSDVGSCIGSGPACLENEGGFSVVGSTTCEDPPDQNWYLRVDSSAEHRVVFWISIGTSSIEPQCN